ncbi:hypothetical protein [Evansella tamaricis]|uniref:Uncharacterized protein n=1 Tax=Evansella tamaricis TaxID=2069301 RepID=A0ABS6JJW5_9BACI|nr:hypothetical protein [Evansella tamaricis]MBU9713107.1 hypothetical protein [Evansella tamaricis]
MFDPTIYDNLKVVLEGYLYELDIGGRILITNRRDIFDLASMSREFSMEFQTRGSSKEDSFGEIKLSTSINDYKDEMIHGNTKEAGCEIQIFFNTKITDVKRECPYIKEQLNLIWNSRPMIKQVISYNYDVKGSMVNRISLDFNRKINEDQIDDIPDLIDHCVQSIRFLKNLFPNH